MTSQSAAARSSGQESSSAPPRQPWLHDLSVTVNGNVTVLSAGDGQIRGQGTQGVFVDDRRILSLFTVMVGDEEPVAVVGSSSGAHGEFLGSARQLGNPGPDPTVEVRRVRDVVTQGIQESIQLTSRADSVIATDLTLRIAGDGAPIAQVKAGLEPSELLTTWIAADGASWGDEWHDVDVSITPAPTAVDAGSIGRGLVARVPLSIAPGQTKTVTVLVRADRRRKSPMDADAGSGAVDWDRIAIGAADPRLEPTLTAAVDDLRHLLLTDPDDHGDLFAAAGAPWYLTLFGRDALWTARMMLPFGTRLAAGTLRALARRQGRVVDAQRAEAPGKIPHELRRSDFVDPVSGLALPTVYYGTIDATPLWITLLRDAWRWGMPAAEIEPLLPNLQFAVRWMTQTAASHPDGLLAYLDATGAGLSNQGWKDSGDAIRRRDGSIAKGPIALVEAQAYAVEAAVAAAELLTAFDIAGAGELDAWADSLKAKVRDHFWVCDSSPQQSFLGLAVDGQGETIDSTASNMGHVLGTGCLSPDEARRVADVLMSPELLHRYGVGTLGVSNAGFNPIGYHTGSIWTHDTAICAWGLSREGLHSEAVQVARTLLASAEAFQYRWPELYAGAGVAGRPAPYPASCRPQAWSAASAAVLLTVALGFEPDAPAGQLTLRPVRPAAFGELTLDGLQIAGQTFGIRCEADGTTEILDPPTGINITVH